MEWLLFPFTALFWLVKFVIGILLLPFKILFGVLGFAFGVIGFILHVGVWLACFAATLYIGLKHGVHPLLCFVLSLLGPIGLLVVVVLAMMRPARSY